MRSVELKKVMVIFGTRLKTIKMYPLVKELKTREKLNIVACVTGHIERCWIRFYIHLMLY